MTRYADPRRCPDCLSAIDAGAVACRTCALPLRGETAQQLFAALSRADALLTTLRAGAVAATPEVAGPTPERRAPAPSRGAGDRRRGLSAASVPKILLALGAGCLLVAALVFLAVTWSVLGVGGRTATLVALTGVTGALAGWAARRGLRAAAESLVLVGLGLLTLDLVGADRAGWFGDPSTAAFAELVGAALLLAGTGATLLARRSTPVRLVGPALVAGLGTALVTGGLEAAEWLPVAPSLVLAVLAAAAVTVATYRLRLHWTAGASAVVTVAAWLSLTGYAVERVLTHDTDWATLWLGLEVWPLLVASAMVAVVAVPRRVPRDVRVGAGAVAHLLVTGAALAPAAHLADTGVVLVGLGVLVGTALATWWLPRPWSFVTVLTQSVAAAGALLVGGVQVGRSLSRLGDVVEPAWTGRLGDRLPAALSDQPAPWLLPLCVLALLGTAWALAHAGRRPLGVGPSPLAGLPRLGEVVEGTHRPAGAALLAGSVVAALALYPVPLWMVVAALLLVTTALVLPRLRDGSLVSLVPAAASGVLAVAVSLHADALTAGTLLVVLVLSGVVHLRAGSSDLAALGGLLVATALCGSVWSWGSVLAAEPSWTAGAALLVAGGLALAAPYGPRRWWACARPVVARAGAEVGAAVAAVLSGLPGAALAPTGQEASWAAVYLTTAGVVVTAMSLLRRDRRPLGWVGGVLLAAATWVRLADLGVHAPEAYTLPSAVALLLVGLAHLRREPGSATMTALAPGLSLAVAPSLLWALADPSGPRVLLLGLACLLLVAAGARLGWTAPVAVGALAGGVLVLRLAAPYIGDAVPRWVLIGAAGTVLLVMGATWERRLTDAHRVAAFVRTLR